LVSGFDGNSCDVNVQTLLRHCNILTILFLACSVITFCSSAYTGSGSTLDAVVIMSDVACIDISSALFVASGSALAALLHVTETVVYNTSVHTLALSMVLDILAATVASVLLGSMNALLTHTFKWSDVGFTVLEGLTTLRGLDFQQVESAPHSYNVVAWPVQSMLWRILSSKGV
jgi:hypothetical protein